jgi:hypothetical protein
MQTPRGCQNKAKKFNINYATKKKKKKAEIRILGTVPAAVTSPDSTEKSTPSAVTPVTLPLYTCQTSSLKNFFFA